MATTTQDLARVELTIGGMTCASCAARIEKKLNRMEGVEATVNYATEKAKITYSPVLQVADLIATVEAVGYTAAPPAPAAPEGGEAGETGGGADDELRSLRERLITAVVLAVPVIVLAMVPAWQFDYW
ncbi:cation transporter, partial [Streptomyces achromogenes]